MPAHSMRSKYGSCLSLLIAAALWTAAPVARGQDATSQAAAQATQDMQTAAQIATQAAQQQMRDAQSASQQATEDTRAAANSAPLPRPSGYGRADKPRFFPRPGRFASATTVEIRDATPKAAIYYTVDGSEPTTASAQYTGPIRLSSTTELRAVARSPLYSVSKVENGKFVIR